VNLRRNMATFEIKMPKLGESIIEATITKWLKKEGDKIAEDEAIVEIATDKVDSEIPSPVEGILIKQLFAEGDVVEIGKPIAVIDMGGEEVKKEAAASVKPAQEKKEEQEPVHQAESAAPATEAETGDSRFYSPLIKNIARQENISLHDLGMIPGSGKDSRLTKQDLLKWLETRRTPETPEKPAAASNPQARISANDEIVEMDRMRQLISQHMTRSVQTSAHVTSFVEIDMTKIALWRERYKESFQQRENIKLTFTPIIIDAIAKAVHDYPQVNVSVDGSRIILHKSINVGMAVSLSNFNLIVPVIKEADQKNILGLAKSVTDLAQRARSNKLTPDEIFGGTISLTNLGSFGTLMGTPIINQPQTAIIAVGNIKKRPVVIETPQGDSIVIRHMMYASLTFDHRVIDGALAGLFLNRLAFYLENFDTNQNL
jgi:2-oxoglutarate dehydrogenase E2 component (dihydrolipoamide succinyltransferase)